MEKANYSQVLAFGRGSVKLRSYCQLRSSKIWQIIRMSKYISLLNSVIDGCKMWCKKVLDIVTKVNK